MIRLFCFFSLLLTICNSQAQTIDSTILRKHIAYLASDKLQGRAPGTKGEKSAADYIAKEFKKYKLQAKGSKGYFQSFDYQQSENPHDTILTEGTGYTGKNVIGYLDNGAKKTIVVGAHYDHLGNDGRGSSLEGDAHGKIHNGADDNASGTAGMLELARIFATNVTKEKTNFLFIAFSAEEAGLIGSKYFTNNPTIPLESIHCMINMDMIGRLVDSTQKLLIFGVGTGDIFVDHLKKVNRKRFELVLDSSGVGPSDQTSFYLKQIPVLHFFTGQHSDYHKSTDDIEKINFKGETKVLNYIADIMRDFAIAPQIKYLETRTKESEKMSFKVTLGVMPDYAFQGQGLRLDAVNKDKPAEKAGLLAGDIVIQLGDVVVNNIYDYMNGLAKYKKGDTVTVIVKRGEESISKAVTF
ncbi:MAG: M20/M25/M40 family metallo-hydrolase [Saprospiraceae bacterium]